MINSRSDIVALPPVQVAALGVEDIHILVMKRMSPILILDQNWKV